ncbi:MAG: bifunctional oligoribonuclease/PAP phosphatase NrnA [Clostridia bacterium]|nr:bifunctional oligoribonuclease/PAP phosphatase NrnA [Clostridia bacterium]
MKITVEKLCKLLCENDGYLILTHRHPDCDTLGSALALTRLLQSFDKKVRAVCSDKITEKQKRLMDGYTFEDTAQPYDHVITVDVATPKLLGSYESLKNDIFLKIDHHLNREDFGEYSYVKDDYASCAEIILDICEYFEKQGKFTLTKDVASYIYCGMSSDTGGFIYSNTKPETHLKAARLLGCGINACRIDEELHITKTPDCIRAEGYALSHIKYELGCKIASVCFDMKTRNELKISEEDIADIVDIPRAVDGVDTAFSIKEEPDGSYRVSLRSGITDVSAVASAFGGGGHMRAAGCTISAKNIDEAYEAVVNECKKHIES